MGWNKLEDILLQRYQAGISYVYDNPVNGGIEKLLVAYEQYTEDILRDLWSKAQSGESFEDWKKKVTKKHTNKINRKRGIRTKPTINGPDLSQM